jgi:DNA polymerase-4
MRKPDGLTVIRPEEVTRVMEHLPVNDLCGIGKKTERQLALLGIRTCGELGRYPVEILTRKFGIVGEQLSRMGRGMDDGPVIPAEEAEEVKSVGHSMTLDRDITERKEILKYLLQLSEMVGRRARRHGVTGKTVHLTVRYADFTTFGRQQTLHSHTNASAEIYREAVAILDSLVLEQPVRLLGVRITNLAYHGTQLPIFPEERRQVLATGAMDMVNDKFGEFTVTFGSIVEAEDKGSHVISPAWRPSGIRNVEVS